MADPERHNRSSGTRQITDIAEDEIVKEAKLALRPFEGTFREWIGSPFTFIILREFAMPQKAK
jgi:hypothetical protein